MPRKLTSVALAAIACLALAAPASGAGLTGTWAGETGQDLGLAEDYTTDIVFTTYGGRIVGISGQVRMLCAGSAVLDAPVSKDYPIGRGPRLGEKGSFTASVQGVRISGRLSAKAGAGSISSSRQDCRGSGNWTVRRQAI